MYPVRCITCKHQELQEAMGEHGLCFNTYCEVLDDMLDDSNMNQALNCDSYEKQKPIRKD